MYRMHLLDLLEFLHLLKYIEFSTLIFCCPDSTDVGVCVPDGVLVDSAIAANCLSAIG